MLMEFAHSQPETQMILLTPQPLSAIRQAEESALKLQPDNRWTVEKFICIKRLQPAVRDEMRGTQQG